MMFNPPGVTISTDLVVVYIVNAKYHPAHRIGLLSAQHHGKLWCCTENCSQSSKTRQRIKPFLVSYGVSKKLLWTAYMEDCRANGDEPLMYSQFCYHIQQDEQK